MRRSRTVRHKDRSGVFSDASGQALPGVSTIFTVSTDYRSSFREHEENDTRSLFTMFTLHGQMLLNAQRSFVVLFWIIFSQSDQRFVRPSHHQQTIFFQKPNYLIKFLKGSYFNFLEESTFQSTLNLHH